MSELYIYELYPNKVAKKKKKKLLLIQRKTLLKVSDIQEKKNTMINV